MTNTSAAFLFVPAATLFEVLSHGAADELADVSIPAVGVTTNPLSTYLSSHVIEDQTPIDEVIFEPDTWVQQSFWLLPDLMTMVSLANSSQLSTWHYVDLYAENLIHQSYLAAWDSFHQSFDEGGILYSATPVESRIQATPGRYLANVCWWHSVLLLVLTFGREELNLPSSDTAAQGNEILDGLAGLDFF